MATELPRPAKPAVPASAPRTISSRELLAGSRTVTIVHGDDHYQLRLTQMNRLILTK
jgi:hemin uptake protein HemP